MLLSFEISDVGKRLEATPLKVLFVSAGDEYFVSHFWRNRSRQGVTQELYLSIVCVVYYDVTGPSALSLPHIRNPLNL